MDDDSRYILAGRLCQTMSARDVTATLKDARKAAALAKNQRPKLLSDNGPCYISSELQDWLEENGISHTRGKPLSSDDARQERALAPLAEKPHSARKLLRAGRARAADR